MVLQFNKIIWKLLLSSLLILFGFCAFSQANDTISESTELIPNTERQVEELLAKLEASEKVEDQINCNLDLSLLLFNQGDLHSSLSYARAAQSIVTPYTDKALVAKIHIFIGNPLLQLNRYANALDHFQLAYELCVQLEDDIGAAISLHNMTLVFIGMDSPEIALEYGRRVIKQFTASNDSNGLGGIYLTMALVYKDLEKYELAHTYYSDAMKFYEKRNNLYALTASYQNMGVLFEHLNELEMALKYYSKALEVAIITENVHSESIVMMSIGRILVKQKKLEAARDTIEQAMTMAKISGSMNVKQECSLLMSEIEQGYGNVKAAYEHYMTYVEISNIIDNESLDNRGTESRLTVQTGIVETPSTTVNWQNRMRDVIVALLAMVLFALVAWMLSYLIKNL